MSHNDLRERLDQDRRRVVDSGVGHPVPGTPRWDAQLGRGYLILFVIAAVGLLAGMVLSIGADTYPERVRGMAVLVSAFPAAFLYGFLYLAWGGFAFVWGSIPPTVIWPDERPILYRLILGTGLTLTTAALVAASWVFVHAGPVADRLFHDYRAR